MAKKIELLHTTYDESGNIESQEVVHPLTSPDCIIMENGKTLDEVMGDGIATPTLTHEGTSFKVGVGDSNIEVVDGDVAGMTLKGQSYQNILPKPTTLIMETDEQEFKINDKIDSNIIIDDNIAEIATVKGKTIVNTVQEESASEYVVLGEDLSGQSIVHVKDQINSLDGMSLTNLLTKNPRNAGGTWYDLITINGEITDVNNDSYRIKDTDTIQTLQPGTYFIQFKVVSVSGTSKINSRTQLINGSQVIHEEYPNNVAATVGINRIKINLTKECNRIGLFYNAGQNSSATITEVMVFEYNDNIYNLDIPYFEGEKYFEANIKGVTLQGQTLVNTIQEPCKDDYVVLGAEDGIEISAETGGHGTIEDTVQGGLNGVVLEGQTLVNIHPSNLYHLSTSCPDGTFTDVVSTTRELSFTVSLDPSTGWYYMGGGLLNLTFIKPSTKYIIMFDKCDGVSSVAFANANSLNTIAHNTPIQINKHGIPYSIVTTLDEYVEDTQILYLVPKNVVGTKVHVTNARIFEYQNGLENLDIPYFEGMKSVQMPVVKTTGKNTLNYRICGTRMDATIKNITNNSITFSAPNAWSGLSWTYFLEPNQTYTASFKTDLTTDQVRAYIRFPNENLSSTRGGSHYFSFTTDSTGKIQFTIESVTGAEEDIVVSEIQIEKGSTGTEYEPYQSSTVTTEKNIFDGQLGANTLWDATGEPSSELLTQHKYTLNYMSCNANEQYELHIKPGTSGYYGVIKVYYYDKDKNYLNIHEPITEGLTSTQENKIQLTIPNNSNIAYMRFRFYKPSDVATYTEVTVDYLTIKQVYTLRGIGDVKDELDLQTGKLTQRVTEIVFDGSSDEDWIFNNTANTTTNRFIITIPKSKVTNDEEGKQSYLCDKLQKGLWSDTRTIGITMIDNAVFLYNKDIDYSINALRNWLQSNPITIQYPLAAESVKIIDLQVTDQDGNTIPHIQTQPTVTHITASSNHLIPTVTINGNLLYDTIIKPSTLYTIRFKHDTVNANNPLTVDLGGTVQTVTSTEFTITTPSTLTHNQLVFSGKNNVVSEVQVIEGDVTNIEYPFFEGMNDVQITDMTRNVNLFDINDTVSGYLGGTGTEIKVPDHGNLTSNYIKVKPNTTYVYNHGGFVSNFADYWTGMYFYQDDKGTESNLYTNGSFNRFVHTGQGKKYSNFKFITPADCEYIRIGSRGLSYDGAWATLYQLDNFDDSKFVSRGKNLLHVSKSFLTTNNYNGLTVTRDEVKQTITINGTCTTDNTSFGLAPFNMLMKEGKRYILSAELISGTSNKIVFRVNTSDWSSNISCVCESSNNYKNSTAMTFWRDRLYNTSSCRVDSGATFVNATYRVMLEEKSEGNATSYEPYKGVEVQQDVDSIPLTSDMFEQNGFNLDNYDATGFSIQQLNIWITTRRIKSKTMIKVKPNTNYVYGDSVIGYALFFDKNGLYIGRDNTYNSITTTHDTQYIAMCLQSPQDLTTDTVITPSALDSMNLILQEVPQEIVLRSIRDVKDELDLTRGEYIQRIGEIVLDGSDDEIWYPSGLNQDLLNAGRKNLVFYYNQENNGTIPNLKTSPYSELSNIICDKLISTPHEHQLIANVTHDYPSITGGINVKELRIAIPVDNSTTQQDSPTCKAWLKQNPIKVQYELATPIIHKVNLTNTKVIQSYATETHYETVTPSDSLIPNITIPSTLNYDVAIKPSTEYTIRANTSDNLTVDLGGTTGTLSNGKVTLTTPATLTHNEIKFSGTGKVKELMVVEGNEIKNNVPFFNGMKDVQMGGIKLVNIARGATVNSLVTANTNKTQFTYTSDGTNWGDVLFDKSLLKQNTLYTIYLNVISSNSDNTNPIKISMGDDLNTWLNISGTGLFKQTFVTNDNIENLFGINFRPCTSGQQVVIQNPMIIEGDWTHLDEIPYIESEMIIDQPIVRSQGKNLLDLESKYFNPSNVTYTKSGTTYTIVGNTENYNYGQFAWTTETSAWFRNLLGKEVTLSVSSISCTNASSKACIQVRMECTDGSKVYKTISTNDDAKYETFTIPSNAIDMALQLMSNNTGSPLDAESTLTVSNIRLELGNTATSYEPYKHQTLYSNRVIGYEENCYYIASNGNKVTTNTNLNSVKADVEGLSIAYISKTSSNYVFWDKDGVFISGKATLDTAGGLTDKDGFIIVPSNAKYLTMAVSNKDTNRLYTDTTVTGDLPLRSLPNGVCDTLNLVTGEYVQNIKEAVIDGSEDWFIQEDNTKTEKTIYCRCTSFPDNLPLPSDWDNNAYNVNLNCDNLTVYSSDYMWKNEVEGISRVQSSRYLRIRLNKNKLDTPDLAGFKQYLSQNPITVQYQLETPIVRKLGFTTKGNYAQANLVTDCKWGASPTTYNNTLTTRYRTISAKSLPIVYNTHLFSNDFPIRYFNADGHQDYEYISNMEYGQYVNVRRDKLEADTVEAFSKWLQQNPIEVGYITWKQTSESYSNIHKPIFFNNVNVQFLPYNLDIQPQLTFQARTRNSYVLDMAKSNTRYTIKAFSNPHDFYIDGKSFGKGTNGCITTPELTNKLMITGSSDVKELMIIEGDVTGKNLPYFKGILSSYHDVDEIEVYSINKNLFDINEVFAQKTLTKPIIENIGVNEYKITKTPTDFSLDGGYDYGQVFSVNVKKGETISFSGYGKGFVNARIFKDYNYFEQVNSYGFKDLENYEYFSMQRTATEDCVFCCRLWMNNQEAYVKNIQVEKSSSATSYIPHAHNSTLIEMPTRLETVKVVRPVMENGSINFSTGANYDEGDALVKNVRTKDYLPVQPGEIIKFYNNGQGRAVNINYYDINKQFIKYEFYDGTSTRPTVPKDCYFVRMYCGKSACSDITLTRQAWKPIQLNSLPNGVCDEIIMKPNSNKVQLVQRVGKEIICHNMKNGMSPSYRKYAFLLLDANLAKSETYDTARLLATVPIRLVDSGGTFTQDNGTPCIVHNLTYDYGVREIAYFPHSTVTTFDEIQDHTLENPITVYYELATPIIHEIQLKGYPHVYENGTVTLNTDTPHQTLVSYNVNQEQLINTQNETIIRHDQQIDDLYYYIEMYLEEIYQMELFRMKLELSL